MPAFLFRGQMILFLNVDNDLLTSHLDHNVNNHFILQSAVTGLVKAFANEWAGSGINVNGIAPVYIATNKGMHSFNNRVRKSKGNNSINI